MENGKLCGRLRKQNAARMGGGRDGKILELKPYDSQNFLAREATSSINLPVGST
jgi:hypothetical protein